MDTEDLIKQVRRIIESAHKDSTYGAILEAKELLRVYVGEKNSFYERLKGINPGLGSDYTLEPLENTLNAFINYVENGLLEGVSIERRAQIGVVSDFLDQANTLLDSKGVHPGAPAVIIGAALEEFLRNWIEEDGLSLGGKKPSLDSYANVLRKADLITKQDVKDITSWGGLRNHAAHGEWDEVKDKNRVSVMLEGVNLFMRKYEGSGT